MVARLETTWPLMKRSNICWSVLLSVYGLWTDCKRGLIVEPFVPKPFLYLMVEVAVPLLLFSL